MHAPRINQNLPSGRILGVASMDGALRPAGSACFQSHTLLVNGLIAVEEFHGVLVVSFLISRNIFVDADFSSLSVSVINTIKLV